MCYPGCCPAEAQRELFFFVCFLGFSWDWGGQRKTHAYAYRLFSWGFQKQSISHAVFSVIFHGFSGFSRIPMIHSSDFGMGNLINKQSPMIVPAWEISIERNPHEKQFKIGDGKNQNYPNTHTRRK